jgi:hypothetical protein
MRVLQSQRDALAYLQDRRAPPQVVKAFGDLIEDAENNYATRTDGVFTSTNSGGLVPTASPQIYLNTNTSYIAPFVTADTSTPVLPQNPLRKLLLVQNLSLANDLYFSLGGGASVYNGVLLTAQQGVIFDIVCPSDSVNVFFDNATPQPGLVLEIRTGV